jgi:hypothetical protein
VKTFLGEIEEEEDRFDFQELLAQINEILSPQQKVNGLHMLNSNTGSLPMVESA